MPKGAGDYFRPFSANCQGRVKEENEMNYKIGVISGDGIGRRS